jgi:hypothetical protein
MSQAVDKLRLASAKQRRGELKDPKIFEKIFERLEKVNGKWKVKPFQAIIRGNKHNSTLPHDVPVMIERLAQLADLFNIGVRSLDGILDEHPNGLEDTIRKRGMADAHAAEYNITNCHRLLLKHYTKDGTRPPTDAFRQVDGLAQLLYLIFNRTDPALLTIDQFRQAKKDVRFFDETGEITYGNLSRIRCIIQFAAMELDGSPLKTSYFRFVKGDEWDMTGKKNIGGKKDDYLFEEQLKLYVQSINEIDTLVMDRLALEGGGRLSSNVLMGKSNVDGRGYDCQLLDAPVYACTMYEPKVKKSKTGGKVTRYFSPLTIAFFKRYIRDYGVVGGWFSRTKDSYAASLKMAGYRAGLWRFKRAKAGEPLEPNEKTMASTKASDGTMLVCVQKAINRSTSVKQQIYYRPVVEGKLTTSHTVGKHTFVSLAGLHGFSLENCAQQCGTDAGTVAAWYHGTLGIDLQKVIMGVRQYVPWNEWIRDTIDPLYTERYNELRRQQHGGIDMQAIGQDEKTAALLGSEGEED